MLGHQPQELARNVGYIMFHGARASAKVKATQYRRSPQVQGGLEIPIKVTIEMDQIKANKLAIKNWKT